jgi:hypothetical protein
MKRLTFHQVREPILGGIQREELVNEISVRVLAEICLWDNHGRENITLPSSYGMWVENSERIAESHNNIVFAASFELV